MSRQKIYQEIDNERLQQDKSWGGPVHDDEHTNSEWVALISRHAGLAVNDGDVDSERFRKQMIRVAALAVAAIESHDRLYPPLKPCPKTPSSRY